MCAAPDNPRTGEVAWSRWSTIGIPLLATIVVLPVLAAASTVLSLWLIHRWNVPLWSVCTQGALCIFFGGFLVWRYVRLLERRRFQVGVRTMLVWVAILSVVFGLFWKGLNRMWRQQSALAHLAANGGYLDQYGIEREEENWLRRQYRFDPFAKITWLDVTMNRSIPVILEHPNEFADLEGFSINGLGDVGVQRIAACNALPRFESITCHKVTFTDAGLVEIAKCENLTSVFISGAANITDSGLKHLVGLKKLRSLCLLAQAAPRLKITDAGLKAVAEMSQLRDLWLGDMPITDAGLKELEKLTHLQELQIDSKLVTPGAIRELGKKLPDCWIQPSNGNCFDEQIKHVVVWQMPVGQTPFKTITDPTQIAKVVGWYHEENERSDKQWDGLEKREPTARICVEFKGRSRCFFRLAFGKESLWFEYQGRWNRRDLTEAEEQPLLGLLELK